jgi:hypothetical protein
MKARKRFLNIVDQRDGGEGEAEQRSRVDLFASLKILKYVHKAQQMLTLFTALPGAKSHCSAPRHSDISKQSDDLTVTLAIA